MNKKEWLDYLYYEIGKQHYDFEVCGLWFEDGEIKSTKWKKYSEAIFPIDYGEDWKIDWINNRIILPFEIVLDIEDKNDLPLIIEKLEIMKIIKYNLYETGSRGYHIHIFFDHELSEERKQEFIEYFGADVMKANKRNMIALENCPHWKTGNLKKEEKWKSIKSQFQR